MRRTVQCSALSTQYIYCSTQGMASRCLSRLAQSIRLFTALPERTASLPRGARYLVSDGSADLLSPVQDGAKDETMTRMVRKGVECHTPKEAQTNLLDFLNQSDIQKRKSTIDIPHFTAGSYLSVTRSDPCSPTGTTRFVGICIARRNKGLGSTFILRNVIQGMSVEMMFELYSPAIKEIKVLKLERRKRAKLYYLRDKPLKYSTVNENMTPVKSDKVSVYKRNRGAPA